MPYDLECAWFEGEEVVFVGLRTDKRGRGGFMARLCELAYDFLGISEARAGWVIADEAVRTLAGDIVIIEDCTESHADDAGPD